MGSAFNQLCPRYSGTLTPSAPTAIRLWETFTFTFTFTYIVSPVQVLYDTKVGIGTSDKCLFASKSFVV